MSDVTQDGSPAAKTQVSPVALVALAAWIGLGVALGLMDAPPGVLTFAFVLLGWMLSVVAHEFGHAYVAWRGGDVTVAAKGYLTLDPFKYADGFTSLLLPVAVLALGGIGLPGGAVYLRQDLMRSPLWRSAASLAGPAGTLVVLVVLAVLLVAVRGYDARAMALPAALAFLAFLQATALVLNLLPVPGLDGYGVIRPFLPGALVRVLRPLEAMAIFLLVGAVFIVPGLGASLFVAGIAITDALGVPRALVREGWQAFRFWQ